MTPLLLALWACNPHPGYPDEGVAFRDGYGDLDDPDDQDYESGERGTVKISEILWSGSVRDDGTWLPDDVFIELRNEGNRPVNLSGWRIRQDRVITEEWQIPAMDREVGVSEHVFFASRSDGCFPEPDAVLPGLRFPMNDPFHVTLVDFDEHLVEEAGDRGGKRPPYAGGYDLRVSRSMERVELMFGARGDEPQAWHFYTRAEVEVPNDDRVAEGCRQRTLASPGRPNSPDYSGAYSSGSLE